MVDSRQTQADVRHFLSENVCKHLGQYQGSCDILVEDFLPEFFQELHKLLNDPKEVSAAGRPHRPALQFCDHLKLCKLGEQRKLAEVSGRLLKHVLN